MKKTQNFIFKKALVMFMAVIMVFTYMPSMAWAEGEMTVQPVDIYVTLALGADDAVKDFAKAKDDSDMAVKLVTVSDQDGDGKLTGYDAIVCMQENLAPEANKDWAVDAKGKLTKLWGTDGSFKVYTTDTFEASSALNTISIKEGSHLHITQGAATNCFDVYPNVFATLVNMPTFTTLKGAEESIYLYTFSLIPFANPEKSAAVYLKKEGSTDIQTLSSDETGKVTLTFSEAGEYLVAAKTTNGATAVKVRVLDEAPKITAFDIKNESKESILETTDGVHTITIDEDVENAYLDMTADGVGGDLIYGCGEHSLFSKIETVPCKDYKIRLDSDEEICKLYIQDRNLGIKGAIAKSSMVEVKINRLAILSGLTTSGIALKDSDFKTGILQAYIPADAQTATITPQASGDGYSIQIDGEAAESGEAHTVKINMQSGKSVSKVTVSKEGRQTKTYQVEFLSEPATEMPTILVDLTEGKTEYIVGDKAKALNVYATASGPVQYQWYATETADGEGTAIKGADQASYTPSCDAASEQYYYCVVTNPKGAEGKNHARSKAAQIIVYDNPIQSFDWDLGELPDLPEPTTPDQFEGYTKGFYYDKDNKDQIKPLKAKLVLSEKAEQAGARVAFYSWTIRHENTSTSPNTQIPERDIDIDESYVGGTEYSVSVLVSFLGRNFLESTDFVYVYTDFKEHTPSEVNWEGAGTETNPWLLKTTDDLVQLRDWVNAGHDFAGAYLKFDADIALPTGWTPIGKLKDETVENESIQKGANLYAFSGTLDGDNHLLTVPEGEKPLFAYVRGAEVKNLNILGKRIEGYGLVDKLAGVGLRGNAITIDNVTLKEGTQTLKAGFIGGECTENIFAAVSAGFETTIRNCTIEKGVVIGYSGEMNQIGSFAGAFQGTIENCKSYATVKGKNMVGGIIGSRDNAMGTCRVENCQFYGSINGENNVGGIAGGGYWGGSAPNGGRVRINNCKNEGTVTGTKNVGGILGGDVAVAQSWGATSLVGNVSSGKVSGESNVGAILGYYESLNKWDNVAYNFYTKDCETAKGIGLIESIDTNYKDPTASEGTTYFNTQDSVEGCPKGWSRVGYNRTDDPLGKDAENLTKLVEDTNVNVCYALEIEGSFKDTYYIGEDLDLTGAVIKAKWTGGVTQLSQSDLTITGYNKSKRAVQTVTLSYQGVSTTIEVVVLERVPSGDRGINVKFTLLGDSLHDADAEGATKHTLSAGNLEQWLTIPKNVKKNSTVWDLMQEVEQEVNKTDGPDIKFHAEGSRYGIYVSAVTYDGTKIGQLDNGKNSGWMYTVNGTHPNITVGAYFLKDGDQVIFHYTDDYTVEEGSEHWNTSGGGVVEEVKDVTTDTKTGTTTAPTEVKVSEKTNADGTKTKVADVKVSADNQKEILKQAKEKKSNEIILVVSSKSVGDATKADVTLEKSFIDSIVKDTDAKLTIRTPFGDKTYTQEELKAMSDAATGSTITVAIEKAEEPTDDAAANIAKAKSITKDLKLVARSSKTAKKNIKAVLKNDAKVKASIKELKDLGFTVKYRFYRSTKKAASYKSTVTKKTASYTNTSGKKGTKYFYKVQVRVYDENGKLITKTALKQCKYASRTWTK